MNAPNHDDARHAALRIAAISLHTSPLDPPGSKDAGGMNVVVLEQARALARAGHRVDLLTRRSDPSAPAVVEIADGLRLLHVDAGEPAPLAKSAMEQAIDPFAVSLDALVAQSEADDPYHLIHAHHWFSGVAALRSPRAAALPLVMSFHSVAAPEGSRTLAAGEPPESSGRVRGERLVAERADLVVTVSDAEARTVRQRYGVPCTRITTVAPGVDCAVFRRPSAPRTLPDSPVLLFAARLQPLKAPDLAIAALAGLAPELGARLVLVGAASDDFADYTGTLRAEAERLGVADRVEFAGAADRERLARHMAEATLMLLPSWSETYGLVALEAQAAGTPVIAWRGAGGVEHAVRDGGILLDDRSPASWARAIGDLLADPERYARMSADAIAFACGRTWDQSAAALADAYGRLLERRGARDPWTVLEQAATVVVAAAHPDDETLSTGPVIARCAHRGQRVVLVTATRGEEGETIPGSRPEGDTRAFTEVRMTELDGAAAALGVAERHMLGTAPALAEGASPRRYRDSGMQWVAPDVAGPAEETGPEALTRRSLDDEAEDLAALLRSVGAGALIADDDAGTYGHPDHVRVHHIAVRAAQLADVPMLEAADHSRGVDAVAGTVDAAGFHWRDTPAAREAVAAALDSHRTQLTVTGSSAEPAPGRVDLVLSGGQARRVPMRTGLRGHQAD